MRFFYLNIQFNAKLICCFFSFRTLLRLFHLLFQLLKVDGGAAARRRFYIGRGRFFGRHERSVATFLPPFRRLGVLLVLLLPFLRLLLLLTQEILATRQLFIDLKRNETSAATLPNRTIRTLLSSCDGGNGV